MAPYIAVTQGLAADGFRYVSRRKGVLRLRGALKCRFGEVPIELYIRDWNFTKYPLIRLLERPDRLSGVQPHIFASGGLCYYSPGIVVLDRFNPLSAVRQCLAQATCVLDELALDATYHREEFTREYVAHWSVGQHPRPRVVVKASVHDDSDSLVTAFLGDRWMAVGSDVAELHSIAKVTGDNLSEIERHKAWVLRTKNWPPLTKTLPANVTEVFQWLSDWDRDAYKALLLRLRKDRTYLDWLLVTVLIEGPHGWLGFDIYLGDESARKIARRDRRAFVQRLHRQGHQFKIQRVSVQDWSPQFVHSRNLTFQDLTDRRITLVGCGAIGSHLAEALVRLGAGQGSKGRLRLVDPQTLVADNLGRNALGYPALGKSKVRGMAEELRHTFPTVTIEEIHGDALELDDLFEDDLLIDATGEEAVSEAINARQQAATIKASPVLYVRVFGEGEAVQSLWVDPAGDGACFRCLRLNDPQQYRKERFPLTNKPRPRQVWRGCQAFTPYAVSAPMHAAALAADVVADWLKGNVSPRFRTLLRPGADVNQVKDQNPSRLPNCPACSARHQRPVCAA